MVNQKIPSKKDKRWSVWRYATKEYFYHLGDNLKLRPEVPKHIHEHFKNIQSLLRFCYYDYDLTTVVFLLCGIAFDAALQLKYKEVEKNQKNGKYITLNKLIEWGDKQGLFEENVSTIHSLRKLRNIHTHQIEPVQFGITGMHLIEMTRNVINGIYDPQSELRKIRKLETEKINSNLSSAFEKSLILNHKDQRLIIFDARLLLYNNLLSKPQYYFAFYPIFEIPENATQVDEKNPILYKCDSVKFRGSGENWKMMAGEVFVSKMTGLVNIRKFKIWKERLKSSKVQVIPTINVKFNEIRNELMSNHIYCEHISKEIDN